MKLFMLNNTETAKLPFETAERIMPERAKRAGRFLNQRDRLTCIGAGLLLHHFLTPNESDICYTSNGKPYLKNEMYFSISHSGDTAVLAFGKQEIGIDIEEMGSVPTEIIPHVFNDSEIKWLETHPEDFYMFWCVKESILKAEGTGFLSDPREVKMSNFSHCGSAAFRDKYWYYCSIKYNRFAVAAASKIPINGISVKELTIEEVILNNFLK